MSLYVIVYFAYCLLENLKQFICRLYSYSIIRISCTALWYGNNNYRSNRLTSLWYGSIKDRSKKLFLQNKVKNSNFKHLKFPPNRKISWNSWPQPRQVGPRSNQFNWFVKMPQKFCSFFLVYFEKSIFQALLLQVAHFSNFSSSSPVSLSLMGVVSGNPPIFWRLSVLDSKIVPFWWTDRIGWPHSFICG